MFIIYKYLLYSNYQNSKHIQQSYLVCVWFLAVTSYHVWGAPFGWNSSCLSIKLRYSLFPYDLEINTVSHTLNVPHIHGQQEVGRLCHLHWALELVLTLLIVLSGTFSIIISNMSALMVLLTASLLRTEILQIGKMTEIAEVTSLEVYNLAIVEIQVVASLSCLCLTRTTTSPKFMILFNQAPYMC